LPAKRGPHTVALWARPAEYLRVRSSSASEGVDSSDRRPRAVMIVGAVVGVAVAIAIVWIFVAGS
jgi:hypothetical protein